MAIKSTSLPLASLNKIHFCSFYSSLGTSGFIESSATNWASQSYTNNCFSFFHSLKYLLSEWVSENCSVMSNSLPPHGLMGLLHCREIIYHLSHQGSPVKGEERRGKIKVCKYIHNSREENMNCRDCSYFHSVDTTVNIYGLFSHHLSHVLLVFYQHFSWFGFFAWRSEPNVNSCGSWAFCGPVAIELL